ncbi:MAG TPA: hypothetical protein VFK22_00805 [Candidatus Dormibacteraeota bacterium]|nr:hypothetical protein [Candidatus Dormibacteraeota bacterium]
MLLPLYSRFWVLVARLDMRLRRRLRLVVLGSGRRRGLSGVDELGNPRLDRLVGRQLGLGVEVEVAPSPVQRADDGVVAGPAVALRVE